MEVVLLLIAAFVVIRCAKIDLGLSSKFSLVKITVFSFLRRCFRLLGEWCVLADQWLVEYEVRVNSHREEVVVPFLGKWMTETLGDMTFGERCACHAVYDVTNKVGLRPRSPPAVESVGRHVRAKLVELGVEEEDVSYWGEMCIQMYFNPPASVKAATGKIEGFQ